MLSASSTRRIERQLQHTCEPKKFVSFCLNLKTTLSPNFNLSHVTIVLSEIHTLRFVPLQLEPRPDTLFPTKLERSRENWQSMDHHVVELGGYAHHTDGLNQFLSTLDETGRFTAIASG